jgi:dTDP-4-dehydrorhamnose 3,5-epimerase
MRFEALSIHQAFLVRIEPRADIRGFFARTFCVREFAEAGLPTAVVQASTSFSGTRGTVRGMHFQWPPSREGKLVRCLRGSLFDVLLDLRPDSPTYLRHVSVALNEDNRDAVFIPHGVAHGFQTLSDSTEVLYQMTDAYAAGLAAGFRWDDQSFDIEWPLSSDVVISERDARYPDFDRRAFESELARRSGAGVLQHRTQTDGVGTDSGEDLQ